MQIELSNVTALKNLESALNSTNFPFKTTYKLTRLFKSVNENNDFYSKELEKLISEYAEKDENGNYVFTEDNEGIKIQKPLLMEFQTKFNELLNLEVTMPDLTFTIDELAPLNLTMGELLPLFPFIEE